LKPVQSNELLIVTNGGGAGVLAVDDLMRLGGKLAPVDKSLVVELDNVLPANWSRANPINIIGDATPERYRATLDAVLADCKADGILVINCPTALASSTDAAQAVLDAVAQASKSRKLPPILTNWLGEEEAAGGRRKFHEENIRYAEREGLRELVGDVLESNTRMLDMCRTLGFEIARDPEDQSICKVRLTLPTHLQDVA